MWRAGQSSERLSLAVSLVTGAAYRHRVCAKLELEHQRSATSTPGFVTDKDTRKQYRGLRSLQRSGEISHQNGIHYHADDSSKTHHHSHPAHVEIEHDLQCKMAQDHRQVIRATLDKTWAASQLLRLKCGDLICLHKCRECGVPHDDREVKQCPADFHHRTQTRQNHDPGCAESHCVCACAVVNWRCVWGKEDGGYDN